jgi:hypothetical protein
VQPERPTVATHAGTVAPGWLELETGGEWDRYPDGGRVLNFPTNLKVGVAPRAQFNITAAEFRGTAGDPSAHGAGDVTLGLKYRLINDGPIVGDFAILPSIKFPTASSARGLGTGTTDVSLLLISSRTVGPADVDINLGATPSLGERSQSSEGFERLDGIGRRPDSRADGLVKWLAADAGVIEPLTGPQPRAVYAGFVWNIGKLP